MTVKHAILQACENHRHEEVISALEVTGNSQVLQKITEWVTDFSSVSVS